MSNWPTGRWEQAAVAFAGAFVTAICADVLTYKIQLARYVHDYPHDGQDGLAAFFDGLSTGAWTFAGAFIVLFVLQRALTKR
jgi:hypothetical protein